MSIATCAIVICRYLDGEIGSTRLVNLPIPRVDACGSRIEDTVSFPSHDPFASTRERIIAACYDLFSQRGVRDVSMDEVIAASGVAKATLYRHFPSKDDLVIAYLNRREELWTFGTVEAGAKESTDDPEGQLLAIFDGFDEWFQLDDFEGNPFINVLLEMGRDHPLGRASAEHLATVRSFVAAIAAEAGLREPEEFARSFHILMKGSIVQATEGDLDAAKRAKAMAARLIEDFR